MTFGRAGHIIGARVARVPPHPASRGSSAHRNTVAGSLKVFDDETQQESLTRLANLVRDGMTLARNVREAAIAIVSDCDQRDDRCEIEAVFDAVKNGSDKYRVDAGGGRIIEPLKRGLRYVADPVTADYFASAQRILESCVRGACAEDCDGHAVLIATLLGSLGHTVGLRAWGAQSGKREYEHVYAMVKYPKDDGMKGREIALDTTVPTSRVRWEPKAGEVLTVWIDE